MKDNSSNVGERTTRTFHIKVLGRTLEHLGVQMYKRRDIAIAELVANSWDAGAKTVHISVPCPADYNQADSLIIITDNGSGMSADQVQDEYLVVGRNRRNNGPDVAIIPSSDPAEQEERPVMGRKGIGKLAGFGVASKMTVITWCGGLATELTLDVDSLKREAGITDDAEFEGLIGSPPKDITSTTGTRLILRDLKHKTPLDLDALEEALARRFSHMVRGRMKIYINGKEVGQPSLAIEQRIPSEDYVVEELPDGSTVKYYYAFAEETIKSPALRGFTIYVRGKTAQAPPFFFQVEGTASGQHGTRYLTGAIEADFLDAGTDDESDLISTDRQEIDWEDERVQPLKAWGETLTRRALREWADRKGDQMEDWILQDDMLRARIVRLDETSRKQVTKFLRELGKAEALPERARALGDALLRAYEYRQFHDVIQEIEDIGEDPDELHRLLTHLSEWKVLESRAILEIVKGRIGIIDKFHTMIVNDAPETPSPKSVDNMHDLIADYPWLLNPEWQVLSEEKSISMQLKEWNAADIADEGERMRYDFLALSDERRLVIIEIKRSGHAVTMEELIRLDTYRERLSKAHADIRMVMICGGDLAISDDYRASWKNRPDGEILSWQEIYTRTSKYYDHYRSVLEGDVDDGSFADKEHEVARTREVLSKGSHRGKAARAKGLGPQDVDYSEPDS